MGTKIKGKYARQFGGGRAGYFNPHGGHESMSVIAPVVFEDDFLGQAADVTHNWTVVDLNDATEAIVTAGASGIYLLHLHVTAEEEEGTIYPNDFRSFVLNQSPIFEARVKLSVLPTLLSELYFGLVGDYVKGELSAADNGPLEHMCFMADGSGIITIHTDDTANDEDAVATGVTVLATEWHVYRIDCSDPADVMFYIDGNRVASATTFDMSTAPTLTLQPEFSAYKSAGAGLGDMQIDKVLIWQNRD